LRFDSQVAAQSNFDLFAAFQFTCGSRLFRRHSWYFLDNAYAAPPDLEPGLARSER
jgi:hypothetical protein